MLQKFSLKTTHIHHNLHIISVFPEKIKEVISQKPVLIFT